MSSLFVGIDWAKDAHRVCIIDEAGRVVQQFAVQHDRDGLEDLTRMLRAHGRPDATPIAIERPSGLLVDALLEAGHPIVPIHPNAVKASRPRYRANHAKDDRGDALLLADLLRTDGHRFEPLRALSDEMRAIRRLARSRDDLIRQRVMLTNQLSSLLENSWPGALDLFRDLASPIALAFLERYPSPSDARRLGVKRMRAFLAKHAYSGRTKPETFIERLKAAPRTRQGPLEANASRDVVLALVSTLRTLVKRIEEVTRAMVHATRESAMGRLVMSFPRTGEVNAAQLVAEFGEDPRRYASRDHLASEAGANPITIASGKHARVAFRYACNKTLRKAVMTWVNNTRFASPWAQRKYQQARAKGHKHTHAIRILARAWLRILYACWQNGTPYDPAIHHGQTAQG
jgi:transposase